MNRRILPAALALALMGGCGDAGSLALRLELPTDEVLRPTGMTTATVRTDVPGESPRVTTATIEFDGTGHGSFNLGELPLLDEVSLTVELRTGSGRLVGYGVAEIPVDLTAGEDVEAKVSVRKPQIFVGGAITGRVETMDPTRDTRNSDYQTTVATVAGPVRAIVALGGARMAVISNGQLRLIDTATNMVIGATFPVPTSINDAAAGSNGWVAIAHAQGVSVMNVDDGRQGELITGRAIDRVAIGGAGDDAIVYALSGRVLPPIIAGDDCLGSSQVTAVPIVGGNPTDYLNLTRPLADIAASPVDDRVFVVDPCTEQILQVATDGPTLVSLAVRPSHLIRSGNTLWAAGNGLPIIVDPGDDPGPADDIIIGGNVVLVAVTTEGNARRQIDLPSQNQIVSNLDDPANELSNVLQADAVRVVDVTILPGDEGVAVLSEMTASTTALRQGPDILIPPMEISVVDMQLVDVASAAVSQRIRLGCTATVDISGNPQFSMWQCASAVTGTVPLNGGFDAAAIGVIYGAR